MIWAVVIVCMAAAANVLEATNSKEKSSKSLILDLQPTSDGLGMYVFCYIGYYHLTMKLQVSLFNKLLSVASTTCTHKCDVSPKFDYKASSISAVSETTSRYDHMLVDR